MENEANAKLEVSKDDLTHDNETCLFQTSTPESDQPASYSYQDLGKHPTVHALPAKIFLFNNHLRSCMMKITFMNNISPSNIKYNIKSKKTLSGSQI